MFAAGLGRWLSRSDLVLWHIAAKALRSVMSGAGESGRSSDRHPPRGA
jgi:hypothetical protein